ncbi:hypothetical protein BDW02DRAFT_486991 [Decorospora gaudefroyi]|uniref:F-box domain-containing protein n=1 Tax=Decorospora gaudefroyi TaxID=184978 RepID=A0A6A5KT64_9PLEO|nr:hypothetical protein BDW02DRAFT_486991 [Decorospora gaudefroyi]
MGFFRRSMSSSSSRSCSSTADSVSTSRTSMESGTEDISDSIATITITKPQPPPPAPILRLPIELIQHVNAYLDTPCSASFCLSSRYLYYALGTDTLTRHLNLSKNRFEKRRNIEAVVERAFPGHWFCAWCDKFHAWTPTEGPKSTSENNNNNNANNKNKKQSKERDCADYNSYLPASPTYTLRYHHIRLAINRSTRGSTTHGLPLSTFTHSEKTTATLTRTPIPTHLQTHARIINKTRFIQHTIFTLTLPASLTVLHNKSLIKHLWPLLPHLLAGHRDSENGHSGLMAAVDNVLRRGWSYPHTQCCGMCATDWAVACYPYHKDARSRGGSEKVRLVVQSWRDFGDARSPFETKWRAHGVGSAMTTTASASTQLIAMAGMRAGDVRRAFESGEEGVGEGESVRRGPERSLDGDGVRRSSARPRAYRTRSENAEAFRQYEEERLGLSGSVAEELLRLDARRGRRQ